MRLPIVSGTRRSVAAFLGRDRVRVIGFEVPAVTLRNRGPTRDMYRKTRTLALLSCLLAFPAMGNAQERSLDWASAERLYRSQSPATAAAEGAADAAELTARSLDTLRRPTVTASAQVVAYEKSLSLDLSGVRDGVGQGFETYLSALPGQFPGDLQSIVAQVTSRVEQALPGLLDPVPDTFDYRARDVLVRPSVSAFLPLYTGGAIEALQDGAGAAARAARARSDAASNLGRVNLARAYFGVTLAQGLEAAANDTLAAMDQHLFNTRAFYEAGVLPRRRVLEVEVARDAAARNVERASLESARAADALQRLLATDAEPDPTTPLFVHSAPLAPAQAYIALADPDHADGHPRVREARAAADVAEAGVRLERARSRPQAYAFGNAGVDDVDDGASEPDWIVGAGVRWTLVSPVSRSKALAAARARAAAAEQGKAAARIAVASEIEDAWSLAEAARRSFLSLESSLAAAEENVRVADLAFRAGEATASDLLDARAALTTAKTQRLAAAYEYDVALAALMAASGQMDDYGAAIARADRRIEP